MTAGPPSAQPDPGRTGVPVCYRHPERETYIRCSRCDRPICPECMIAAPVGFQCPECVRQGSRGSRMARTLAGGRVAAGEGYVTKAIIAVNVGAYVLQQVLGRSFTTDYLLLSRGVDAAGDPIGVAVGEWYRLLTAAFLHGSILHIALNMYVLWLFGPPLEQALGRARFVALYLLSALGGSTASYALAEQPSLGASGAIFGLFAAYIVLARRLGQDVRGLFVWLGLNVVLGLVLPTIDWRAHAGGFVTGGLLGALFLLPPATASRRILSVAGCVLATFLILAVDLVRTASLLAVPAGSVARCIVRAPLDPGTTFVGCLLGDRSGATGTSERRGRGERSFRG